MTLPQAAGDPSSPPPSTIERAGNGQPTSTFWANTFDLLNNRSAYAIVHKAEIGPASQIASVGATVTINATSVMSGALQEPAHKSWYCQAPASDKDITLKSTSPAPADGAEIEVSVYAVANTKVINILREDLTNPITMTGATGTATYFGAKFKFIASKWRLITASADGGMLINDP